MSQSDTLIDIYSKIADIYDKFCDGVTATDSDPLTMITNEVTINENTWVPSSIVFSNPENDSAITTAQTQINNVLTRALNLAKDESTKYANGGLVFAGAIVPVPEGSPITFLPKLIKLLVLYQAPLKFLMNTILDYIKDSILEDIKENLNQKRADIFNLVAIPSSQLVKIPKDAIAILVNFDDIPAFVGKRFAPQNLNIDIIQPQPTRAPDLSKFILSGLGTCQIGFALTDNPASPAVFWSTDTKLEYNRQVIYVPDYKFTNYQCYAYLHLEYENTCRIAFLKFS